MDACNRILSPLDFMHPTPDSQRGGIQQRENPFTQAITVASQSGSETFSQGTYDKKANDPGSPSKKRTAKKAPQLEPMTSHSIEDDCFADADAPDDECVALVTGLSQASLMDASSFAREQVSQQHSPNALTFTPPRGSSSPCPSPSGTTTSSFDDHHHNGWADNGVQSSPPNVHPGMRNSSPPSVVLSTVSTLSSPFNNRSNNPNEPPQPDVSTSDSLSGTPLKARGNAKVVLQERCNGLSIRIPSENYVTCDDGGKSHETKFTGILVWPQTGECFPSGELNSLQDDNSGTRHRHLDHTHWYGTKKKAKEAAAGRAEDCFRFREGVDRHQFCVETPYGVAAAVMDPDSIPSEELQMIRRLQKEAKSRQ